MTDHTVVIAGGGPTGMMLAAELALAGIDVAIVERRASQELVGSRAGGLHARTIEVFDQRGIAERFISEGKPVQVVGFQMIHLDISDFPTRHPHTLGLWQAHIERILAEWIGELNVLTCRGREVTGFTQDDTGVDVELSDGQSMRAQYLIGCDGGRSRVRKAEIGVHGIGKLNYEIRDGQVVFLDGGPMRVMVTERNVGATTEPTLRDLSEALIAVYGTDYGVHNPTSLSRFTDMTRQAASYRDRRVLLAGDAAHVHSPDGGQGLNTGVQDAVNLGWKLAQVIKRTSPESLLDSYHAERHPVGARVLQITMAAVALRRPDERAKALRGMVAELLGMDEPRKRVAAEMSGLGIRYDFGNGHPLLGRRMPDLDLVTAKGPLRVFTLLHKARPALINFGEPGSIDIAAWSDRVQVVDAKYEGVWELPALGRVSAPSAVLIRPDGYVGWVSEQTQAGLTDALTKWFGPSAA
jgi:2-polyprenyl-6-methoxyphenol hydroxylase-like FAD-dependent oxidoreductase